MSDYQAKMERRKERYEALANKAEKECNDTHEKSRRLSDMIPFGQPILVGHHSEKRARRDQKRLWDYADKCVELAKKAEYYKQKAEACGRAGISSDDPEALQKLYEKLAKSEELREFMKQANKIYRKYKKEGESVLTVAPEKIKTLILNYKPEYSWKENIIFTYELKNLGHNILDIEKRIARLEAEYQKRENNQKNNTHKIEYQEFKLIENTEQNRLQILFNERPSPETISILKHQGFRWSPTNKAWQRQLNESSRYAFKRFLELYNKGIRKDKTNEN